MSLLGLVLIAATARADASTGTWTGELALQGNYYWETSTRVVAPQISFRLTSPEGTDIRASYLVDAITSASIASGVTEDVRFTEVRNQVTAGIGKEFDLGDTQLRLDAGLFTSHEPDYLATSATLSGALSLAQRCSIIGLALTYVHDDVGRVVRDGGGGGGSELSDRGRVGQLEAFTLGLSFQQILGPQLFAAVGYDLVQNWGFLQNAYRSAVVSGTPQAELHPDTRLRHSLYGRLAGFVPETRTSLQLMYRFYVDEWDIAALTPEARIYQEVGDLVTLRLRYRFYAQTRSFFWDPSMQYPADALYVSNDPKMSEFHSHLVGAHARLLLGFLDRSAFEFFRDSEVWVSFDYLWQTSRFGDAVIAQAALRVPF